MEDEGFGDGFDYKPEDDLEVTQASSVGSQTHYTRRSSTSSSQPRRSKSGRRSKSRVTTRVESKKKGKGAMGAVISILLIAAVGAAFFIFVLPRLGSSTAKTEAESTEDVIPVEAVIPLEVYSPGLDSKGSRVPVHVFGFTLDGEEIDRVDYVDENGFGLKLSSGEYEVVCAGSPINAAGEIYAMPTDSVTLSVDKIGVVETGQEAPWELIPLSVEDTDRKAIEDAALFIATDPERSHLAEQLKNRAMLRIGVNLEDEKSGKASDVTKTDEEKKDGESSEKSEGSSESSSAGSGSTSSSSGSSSSSSSSSGSGSGSYSGGSSSSGSGSSGYSGGYSGYTDYTDYTDYTWTLARVGEGGWRLLTWGYA